MSTFCMRSSSCLRPFITDFPLSLKVNQSAVVSVRWRKPRWVPQTKTKYFYVRKPTEINQEEYVMMQQKNNIYRTEMKAVRKFLTQTYINKKTVLRAKRAAAEVQAEEETYQRAVQINTQWNEESAKLREARLFKEAEKKAKIKLVKDSILDRKLAKELHESETFIAEATSLAETFITMEKLDEEIEKALDSRTDYNFAIDRSGNTLKDEVEPIVEQPTKTQSEPETKV